MDPLTAVVAGSLVGLVTGLLPGLHVNTLAAISVLVVPVDSTVALGLVAVGTVHTIVNILPATYLGAPDQDAAMTVLPAHRMLREGRAPEAVRISVHASLAAVVAAVLLILPLKWWLGEPVRALAWLERATPGVLVGALAFLIWQDARRNVRLAAWAAAIMVLAGALGILAWRWPTSNPWGVQTSALLPMLSGLFAAPGLLHAASSELPIPLQDPPRSSVVRGERAAVAKGIVAASFTAVMPGLTAATATALAHAGSDEEDPRPVIATLSAVNTAHACLAITMLWLIGTTRSGLGSAIQPAFAVQTWHGALPPGLHAVAFALLAAGTLGAAATLALEPTFRAAVLRVPAKALHVAVLVALVAGIGLLTGIYGLALFVVAAAIGLVPLAVGVRRVHLAACLIVPILLAKW